MFQYVATWGRIRIRMLFVFLMLVMGDHHRNFSHYIC
ncbi:hypothetical protein BVRB_8g191480 [Beta vulgaris subsp. vulgaris]|nr:hypothetical protein BVRB_8g191480 [Beta vulgaris subsp. vulgaris]